MADTERLLKRWQGAGVLDAAAAERIRAYEAGEQRPAGMRWQVVVALVMGAILLVSGVFLFVSAHWDELAPWSRFALVIGMVAVFHVAGAWTRDTSLAFSTTFHAIGTLSVGGAIALVGQIFNIQEHWPAAVLMWAVAALAGWALLHDEAQQTMTLLLFPAWMLSELGYNVQGYTGSTVYTGRFLLVWSILYLTVLIDSKRRAMKVILFIVAAVYAIVGTVLMLMFWNSWGETQFIPLHTRVWAWVAIAALPILFSLIKRKMSTVPVLVALVFGLALPWCYRTKVENYNNGMNQFTSVDANLLAYALVGLFTIFFIWWGMRQMSTLLVNLGIVGFAMTVFWFYYGNVYDKLGRSLGLIGLGVLFLAGGWALEKMRRRLVAQVGEKRAEGVAL